MKFNKEKMKEIFDLFFYVLIITLIIHFVFCSNIFASDLTVTSIDSNGFDWGSNGKEIAQSNNYYWCIKNSQGNFYIIMSENKIGANNLREVYSTGGNIDFYKLVNGEYVLSNSITNAYTIYDWFNPMSYQAKFYSNYDVGLYNSGNNAVFFQTPLTSAQMTHRVKGGMMAEEIIQMVLIGIKSLIHLIVVFSVLVIGFRKGWKMLRTVFLGA